MNNKFLYNLNDFQNSAVNMLLKYKNKLIIIKSQKFTGKTMLASKLFKYSNNDVVIYHTGCCPELFNQAKEQFKNIIYEYKDKNITLILDEFYDYNLIELLIKLKNITCYILTNDFNLNNKYCLVFNYYNYYKTFIINEKGKYLNLHEAFNKNVDFLKNCESFRQYSKSTRFFVYENKKIKDYYLEI